jgi:RNA polymerase sigma-70 factor (ECF subfamily)
MLVKAVILASPNRYTMPAPVPADPADALDEEERRGTSASIASFESIYRENVGRVYGLCLRLAADPARAEQLTQDVFVRAWERLSQFRGESSMATWLRHVTVTVVLDERRARMRRERRVLPSPDEELAEAARFDRSDDESLDLERAIGALPDGARTVLVLHDVEGYRHDEIASLCGIAEGTSKAQLFRARKLLKEVLR